MPGLRIWAVEDYDWSDPHTIRWTVRESNFSKPGSYVAATTHPRPDGGTRVHIEWEREGSTLAGRVVVRLIAATKGRPIAASIRSALEKLERSGPPAQ